MMERSDLVAFGTQTLERFFDTSFIAHEAESFAVRISSGTTGGTPLVLVTEHPTLNTESASRKWWGGGEHTLLCYGSRNLRLFNALSAKKYSNSGGALMVLGAEDLSAGLVGILADFMPRRIIGSPSFIARAAEYMNEQTRKRVLYVQCAGETVSKELTSFFAAQFPKATLRSVYTAVDVGPIVCVMRESP
jgi:phenylacetate-coenzyme A ligase PaaK-like adenylate-forming protein